MRITENKGGFIKKIYLSALFPNVIAVLGGTINVFFDGILVGQRLGETGLASVSQSLPIYLVLCTIGSLFASGAAFLSSRALGENRMEDSRKYFRAALLYSTVAAVIVSLSALAFISPLTELLASAETKEFVRIYVSITLIGGVFKVLLYVPFFYLRLEGKNRESAIVMALMTVLNIVLDYVFLFKFDFGIAGTAWASVAATAVALILSFVFLFSGKTNFRFGFSVLDKSEFSAVLKNGSPMALNNVLSSLRILVLNLILKSTGISSLVAVFAVINNLNEFSICLQNGIPQTASAMTGIFFGEKDSVSVKELLKTQIRTGLFASIGFSVLLCVFSSKIGLLFGTDIELGTAVIMFAISLVFAVINNVMSYYYNAIARIEMANMITVLRGFLLVEIFALIFSFSENYIWLFYPFAEIATFFAIIVVGKIIAKKKDLTDFYLIDESFERSGKSISFSTDCTSEKICAASEGIRDFCENNEFGTKKTMAISLAIEEMLTIIAAKSVRDGTIDVRVIKSGEDAILRIRSLGERYNPIEEMTGDLEYMGVQMISKIAKKTEYLSSLGVNTLLIFL